MTAGMIDWALNIVALVLVSVIGRLIWKWVGGLKWEKEIPSSGESFWRRLGYYIDEETNQWAHKCRPPISALIQEDEKNVPSQLASGYTYVKTKYLKRKVFTYSGNSSKKVYFLEPPKNT